ncbi:MAG TPA: aldehyde dehydrogenase family protein [Candidatus Dormibacteraeota bacterium]|jgi:acyl-CoA reductase-like NAD-dependent aldehyde dehydrogenase|nr:aldehyde dehydrogenase family protein [Candidatus Dormibacteraeota bacterium]
MASQAISAGKLPSYNPATGEVTEQLSRTNPEDVEAIVGDARSAQVQWRATSISQRRALLDRLREKMLAARSELADMVVRESGKPRVEALFADVFVSLDTAAYYIKNLPKLLQSERVPHHNSAAKLKSGRLFYEPIGVLGVISSWNYPLAIPLGQIIAAVAAGNGVVCKTSEFTPKCGERIQKLFNESGFPDRLVNIIQGGGEIGQALIDARPDKVLFTGSVSTGRRVAEACAKQLIPSVLELGGKDAMLVLADANLEVASSAALWGSFTNCGQVCLSVERLFVEGTVSEKFLQFCAEKTKTLRLGNGADPATDVGPLIRPQHVQRMKDLLTDATSRGARILCGGNARPDLGPCFFEPTVIADVNTSMRLFQEETFGPILAVQTVLDEEDAILHANNSPFSLAASVWTSDSERGRQIATRLRAGAVMVNDAISYFAIAEAPHGGCNASGWGRTHGRAGFLEMVQPKYVDVDGLSGKEKPWWYHYNESLGHAADDFLNYEFGGIGAKLKYARGALKTFFRDHGFGKR